MHFTFTDSAVECACLVFVLCITRLKFNNKKPRFILLRK